MEKNASNANRNPKIFIPPYYIEPSHSFWNFNIYSSLKGIILIDTAAYICIVVQLQYTGCLGFERVTLNPPIVAISE